MRLCRRLVRDANTLVHRCVKRVYGEAMRDASALKPAAVLGLVGDGDDVDLLVSVEQAFGVTFGDEVQDWHTVGDMHAAVLRLLPPTDTAGRCATAMAFYRLRHELRRVSGVHAIVPATPLREAAGAVPPREFRTRFGHAGFQDHAGVTRVGCWGWAGWLLLAISALMPFVGLLPWTVLAILGAVLVVRDPLRFRDAAVGQIAREVAARNARRLMDAGADRRPQAVWTALAAVVGMDTGVLAKAITPGTRFYPPR